MLVFLFFRLVATWRNSSMLLPFGINAERIIYATRFWEGSTVYGTVLVRRRRVPVLGVYNEY